MTETVLRRSAYEYQGARYGVPLAKWLNEGRLDPARRRAIALIENVQALERAAAASRRMASDLERKLNEQLKAYAQNPQVRLASYTHKDEDTGHVGRRMLCTFEFEAADITHAEKSALRAVANVLRRKLLRIFHLFFTTKSEGNGMGWRW